jgi:hypothetical protein
LVDLGDAVADELSLPFDRIYLQMVYRGLYHFHVAHQKGLASDPVQYFAAPSNQNLGIVKQKRKTKTKLIVAPFTDKQRSQQFLQFLNNMNKIYRKKQHFFIPHIKNKSLIYQNFKLPVR